MYIYKNQGRSFTNLYDLKIWNKILNIMDKSVIINRIIKEVGATSYLEIGYGNGHNFNQIDCDIKTSTDPTAKAKILPKKKILSLTSDEFFENNTGNDGKNKDYDVVFIDGLHHSDQVRKDIINSLKRNAKAIILHDVLPKSKAMQEVPRNTKEWTGDVWRAVVGFKQSYPDVRIETYRSDYGLSVIYPEGKKVKKHFENKDMTYGEFKADEVNLLNIID